MIAVEYLEGGKIVRYIQHEGYRGPNFIEVYVDSLTRGRIVTRNA